MHWLWMPVATQADPAGQAWHADCPMVAKKPLAQGSGGLAALAQANPAGQVVHSVAPLDEKCPAGQACGLWEESTHNDPAGQAEHVKLGYPRLYVPGGQGAGASLGSKHDCPGWH